MTSITTDARADVAALISSIARRIHDCEQTVADVAPLSSLEVMVLRDIERHRDTNARDLARRLSLRPSNASTVIQSLCARELVHRVPDVHDGRVMRLQLTDAAVSSIADVRTASSRLLTPHLSGANAEQLRALLTEVEASFELACQQP